MNTRYTSLIPFILILCHFAFDWTYQSHKEALAKSKDRRIRLLHCLKYSVPFVPVLVFMGMSSDQVELSWLWLFGSHYVIDSYVPVMLWAKHLRKAPQFDDVRRSSQRPHVNGSWRDRELEKVVYASDEAAFRAFASTPLGLILVITMDQFLHIACLLPVAIAVLGYT